MNSYFRSGLFFLAGGLVGLYAVCNQKPAQNSKMINEIPVNVNPQMNSRNEITITSSDLENAAGSVTITFSSPNNFAIEAYSANIGDECYRCHTAEELFRTPRP